MHSEYKLTSLLTNEICYNMAISSQIRLNLAEVLPETHTSQRTATAGEDEFTQACKPAKFHDVDCSCRIGFVDYWLTLYLSLLLQNDESEHV